MAKTKEKKISELNSEELVQKHEELAKELYSLKCEYQLNRKLDKPHKLKSCKKDIARVLTAFNSKKNEKVGS